MPPAVQRLPYIPPSDSRDHFDLHQFWKRARAVSPKTEIAFSDYQRMHGEQRSALRDVAAPPFAANDEQLADVIAHRCWQYCQGGKKQMPDLDKKQLKHLATLKLNRIKDKPRNGTDRWGGDQHEKHQLHIANMERIGYVQMQAAVAYRSWRLNWPSTEVAASLGLTPWNVRIMLYRLVAVAKKLGYPVNQRRHVGSKYLLEQTQ